jgi:hypothetical protein
MKVVILAGGVGSRLAEETEVKPKPMVEIGRENITSSGTDLSHFLLPPSHRPHLPHGKTNLWKKGGAFCCAVDCKCSDGRHF